MSVSGAEEEERWLAATVRQRGLRREQEASRNCLRSGYLARQPSGGCPALSQESWGGVGEEERVGWTGSLGLVDANYCIWVDKQ